MKSLLRPTLLPLALVFGILTLFSGASFSVAQQTPAAAPVPGATPVEADKPHKSDKTLLDLYHEGGPIMHVIAACSVATLALGLYCLLTQSKGKLMPGDMVTTLRGHMESGDVEGAVRTCQGRPGPFSRAVLAALGRINYHRHDLGKVSMENAVADECFREETKMMVTVNYLNTFAVMAPMIGLLGTVSGMITSFSALTAGKAEATELAGGIGEALVATAGGLMLAIPAMFMYFYFRGMVQAGMADMHKTVNELIDTLTQGSQQAPQMQAETLAA